MNGGRPLIIGLCGRSGSGKGYLCGVFRELGVPSVDTDAVYRTLTSAPDGDTPRECTAELVKEFGDGILATDLSLNRRALAETVFSDGGREKLKRLNSISHRYILAETDRLVAEYGKKGAAAVIVDAPVLFESGYDKRCDVTLAAVAEDDVLLRRIAARDGISRDAAAARLASQKPNRELVRLTDFVIETNTDRETLKEKAADILRQLNLK